ncbi:MAG: 23S rRNA (guanosine(2251)-2'-O)-methyltransferase RlmB [Desulfonauticus sp.]|nr:23S rRNA (guanosine(2251)-2'-O)-methyltransferase RlmB [Desulfonauticus sp.]
MAKEFTSILVGLKPVLDALQKKSFSVDRVYIAKNRKNIQTIVELCKEHNVTYKFVPQEELNKLYSGNHQGIIARISTIHFTPLENLLKTACQKDFPLILALDCVQDPQNIGSMVRTLVAFGGQGVIVPKDRSAFLGPGVVKSSAGAIYNIAVSKVVNLNRALEQADFLGYHIYAGMPRAGTSLFECKLNKPAILVLGNEQRGIRPGVLKRCQTLLTIPMPGQFESLNVAQAAAIFMSEFLRQWS